MNRWGISAGHDRQGCSSPPHAIRDYALVRGSYFLGCRVSELCRLCVEGHRAAGWRSNSPPWQGEQSKDHRVSSDTLELFESLGRGEVLRTGFSKYPWNGPSDPTSDWRCMPNVGTSRRRSRSPAPLRHTHAHSCAAGWTSSRFKRRSVTRRARPRLITFLQILVRVHLCVLVSDRFDEQRVALY